MKTFLPIFTGTLEGLGTYQGLLGYVVAAYCVVFSKAFKPNGFLPAMFVLEIPKRKTTGGLFWFVKTFLTNKIFGIPGLKSHFEDY